MSSNKAALKSCLVSYRLLTGAITHMQRKLSQILADIGMSGICQWVAYRQAIPRSYTLPDITPFINFTPVAYDTRLLIYPCARWLVIDTPDDCIHDTVSSCLSGRHARL